MKINNREELIKLLELAKEKGALKSIDDFSLRDIRIETPDGARFRIEWYCNLCTLKNAGFSMWFDCIEFTQTHPCFLNEIRLSYQGVVAGVIGKPLDHLTKSFEV